MSNAILYLRVSTEEQVSNLSLDTQEAECRALCARKGWSVAAVFREEGVSAKSIDRPELNRLLDYVARNRGRVRYLVFLRVDRLARESDYYILRHTLTKHGVELVSAREEIDGDSISAMIVESIAVLQARIDNRIRSQRAKAGMTEAARRGRWVWQAPVGYRHAPHDQGRPAGLELDPQQAPLVARAFELVAGGTSADSAYRELVAAGLQGRRGRPIGRETFHALFRKPLYCGRLEVASWGIAAASTAPPIVDETTFARARTMLDGRKPVRRATASLEQFPLRGVTRCACGRKLTAFKARGKTGRRWPYYRCQRCRVQVPGRGIDAAFVRLLERMSAPEAAVALVDRLISAALDRRAGELQLRLSGARRNLATAQRRLDRLFEMRSDGEIQADEYVRGRERAERIRDAAQVELADLAAPLDVDRLAAGSWARRLLTQPATIWGGLDGAQRAAFVERVFPTGLTFAGGEFSNPANCLLALPLGAVSSDATEVVAQTVGSSNTNWDSNTLFAWLHEVAALRQAA